jgi:hypothetical protein
MVSQPSSTGSATVGSSSRRAIIPPALSRVMPAIKPESGRAASSPSVSRVKPSAVWMAMP